MGYDIACSPPISLFGTFRPQPIEKQSDFGAEGGWLPGTDETQNYELPIAVESSPQLPKRRKRDRDRDERIRLAGGPKPSLREKAYAFARERATVRTYDFTAIGIPRHYLAWMCEEGLLVKVGYGVYRAADREAA